MKHHSATQNLSRFLSVVFLLLPFVAGNSSAHERVSKYVNPNIGIIHSSWFFYTPAAVPFGMAKLGPSTNGTARSLVCDGCYGTLRCKGRSRTSAHLPVRQSTVRPYRDTSQSGQCRRSSICHRDPKQRSRCLLYTRGHPEWAASLLPYDSTRGGLPWLSLTTCYGQHAYGTMTFLPLMI